MEMCNCWRLNSTFCAQIMEEYNQPVKLSVKLTTGENEIQKSQE